MEISRSDREYITKIPVPGFRPEQIEVTVQDDTLIVSGKGDRRSFTRSLTLPEEIDTDSISATVDLGMLGLKLQQRPEASLRIQVQSGPRQATGVTAAPAMEPAAKHSPRQRRKPAARRRTAAPPTRTARLAKRHRFSSMS